MSKYIPKEEATRIIGDQRKEAFEKGYSKAREEALKNSSSDGNQASAKTSQKADVDIDEVVNKRIQEFQQKLEQEAQAKTRQHEEELQKQQVAKMAEEMVPKIQAAEKEYADFNEVTSNVNFGAYPEILAASNGVDNTGHVLYELAKNPGKLAVIDNLMAKGSQKAAMAELRKLSNSIKQNQVSNSKRTPTPLNSVKSSNVGDSGQPLSIADRKKIWRT